MRVLHNVVTRKYHLIVTFADKHTEEVDVEAESLSAAALKLPPDAVAWEQKTK